jgi:hypothetical protein
MTLLLRSLLALAAAADPACPAALASEQFLRCSLGGTISLSLDPSIGSTAVYVHNSRSATLAVAVAPFPGSFSVAPGSGIQIFLANATNPRLTCADCLLTIWHSQFSQSGATFVSDAPGAVFTTGIRGRAIRNPYAAFFDFGNNTRLRVTALQHHRETPLTVLRDAESETVAGPGDDVDLAGPGIFEIASSPVLPIGFRIIVGSTTKIPDGFSNRAGYGSFAELNVVDEALVYVPASPAPDFVLPAVETTAFRGLSWVVFAIMLLVGIGGIVCFVHGIVRHFTADTTLELAAETTMTNGSAPLNAL